MDSFFALATSNLLAPTILCFALGLAAALARSDLALPEAAAKGISIYLLFAIGFKGGAAVSAHGFEARLALTLLAGTMLSFALPLVAWTILTRFSRVDATNAAAIAGHYGSISIVTFVAATSLLETRGLPPEGYMVAVAAAMEAPAIISALWLAARRAGPGETGPGLLREVLLNGSIVLLVGAFFIGLASGPKGLLDLSSFIVAPFTGVLCLFLLDMGLVAGRSLAGSRGKLPARLLAFGLLMPPLGAAMGLALALPLGLSLGGTVLLMTLAGSASYIAVPAAMRVALPRADAGISLTLALGITFPFNLVLGIPLYLAAASFALA
ncbi:sodium-dependent bicarbonate transport family permease [Limimaricola variabilis]|uniref:sodium-dependent bicarbonate transport family permease n=1 Tax=Limimaricola variabilis TaxID=1492771 RepID=UPI002AC9B433|nr:sodium-dependent bicarbonate transport family permease [Limimaricola variabilis]WPY94369.1 sodium-dependent bicarbonate transport family permease [Limimaricola variabilis]